jgi:hypothetical protein
MDEPGQDRAELLARLSEVLGPEPAATLMENLHPRPWSELSTKDDVGLLKADLDEVKQDLEGVKQDLEGVKQDLATLTTDVQRQFAHLSETMSLRFAAQSAQLEALIRERIDAQTKLVVFSVVGAVLTTAGIAIGSAAI